MPDSFHWIDPNGAEITEFAGHNDDCLPCANEVCLATVQNRKPSTMHMNVIRQRDLDAGWLRAGSGQTIDEMVNDVERFESEVTLVQTPPHGQTNYVTPNNTVLWQALHGALLRGNSCVLNIGNAQALPGNERGVQWHGVACIGIDSVRGYLISNGDEIPFDGQPNWVTWQDLVNAKLVSVVEYKKGATPAPISGGNGVLNIQDVAAFYTEQADGSWVAKLNACVLKAGFQQFYRANDGLKRLGLPLDNEASVLNATASYQVFERGVLNWDPQRKLDNPPETGDIYYAHIDQGHALAVLAAPLNQQIAALTATNQSLQQQHTDDAMHLSKDDEQIQTLQNEVTQLQQELAASEQNGQLNAAAVAFIADPSVAPFIAAAAKVAAAGHPLN